MRDSVYLRIAPSSMDPATQPPSLASVIVDALPMRRRSNSKSSFWKNWRKYRHTINIDKLARMRLRWRTVAKVLGGILFFKIGLSILGSLVGSEPTDSYMGMPGDVPRSEEIAADSNQSSALLQQPEVTQPPPPPPPIPPPKEAITCDGLRDFEHMVLQAPEVDQWQTIQLGISFGYSAFYDDRLEGVVSVKVMALADEWLDAKPPLCQLWFKERVEPFALPLNITNFPAQPTARYKAVMYTCRYTPSEPDMPPPVAVSLSSEACAQPLSMFRMHIFDRSTPPDSLPKFSVCLASPMRLNYSEPGEMVDWVEVHKLFGVTKYNMYIHDIAPNVKPFLQYYVDKGEMTTLSWKLPPEIKDPRESVKAFGQLAMINDCLYRNMFRSRYLVYLDLDEMMVPRGTSKTLEEALVTTSCQDKAQTIIRSAFFRKQWTNDEKYAADERMVKRSLISLLKTKRERKVLAINVHAKYIVIPEKIEALETLAALQFLATVANNTGEATCVLLAKECLLHHYRYYDEFYGDWMIDRKMHEFTKPIVERTGAVHEAVNAMISAQAAAGADAADAAEAAEADEAAVANGDDAAGAGDDAPPNDAPVVAPAGDNPEVPPSEGGAADSELEAQPEAAGAEPTARPDSPDAAAAEAAVAPAGSDSEAAGNAEFGAAAQIGESPDQPGAAPV